MNSKKNVSVFLLLVSFIVGGCYSRKAQKTEVPTPIISGTISKLLFVSPDSTRQAKAIALENINSNNALLILEETTVTPFSTNDSIFQKQYGVKYEEQGKNRPNPEAIKVYNWTVFNHLNNRYGAEWTKTVRQDVLGVKDWRKYKK
jgi:hypothetical protein